MIGPNNKVEITSVADIPGKGTGLGSSSAFAVGLLNTMTNVFQYRPELLARQAYHLERNLCKKPVGKQDHFASSIGGINLIVFKNNDEVEVHPISKFPMYVIQQNCLLLYTGITRSSKPILSRQGKNLAEDKNTILVAHQMYELATSLFTDLSQGVNNIGLYLHSNWQLKKKLSGNISSPELNLLYDKAMDAGAEGGKLCGAGGGGFFLFYAPPEKHEDIVRATGLRPVDFKIEPEGSKIIYDG